MKFVFPGLMMTIFLAALDQTIAAVALPTIVADIGGESGYSWVGSAYLLSKSCGIFSLFVLTSLSASVCGHQSIIRKALRYCREKANSFCKHWLVPIRFRNVWCSAELYLVSAMSRSTRHWRGWNCPDGYDHNF